MIGPEKDLSDQKYNISLGDKMYQSQSCKLIYLTKTQTNLPLPCTVSSLTYVPVKFLKLGVSFSVSPDSSVLVRTVLPGEEPKTGSELPTLSF